MVQFTTAASLFVVAVAVAPILATPIDLGSELEVREPKGFRGVGQFARKAGRFGASAAGALAGRDLAEEFDLEAREPGAPGHHSRPYGNKGRNGHHHKNAHAAARRAGAGAVAARDLEWEDVEVREPKQGHKRHHKKGGRRHRKNKKAAAAEATPTEAREFDELELEAREPKQGHKRHHKKGGKKHRKHRKAAAASEAASAEAREFDELELEVRELKQGHKRHRKHGHGGKRHLKAAASGAAEALAAREPLPYGGSSRSMRRPVHPMRHANGRGLGGRDLEDLEDLLAREFDDEFDLD